MVSLHSQSDQRILDLYFLAVAYKYWIWIFQAAAYDAEINLISLSEIIEVCSDTHHNKTFIFISSHYVCNLIRIECVIDLIEWK